MLLEERRYPTCRTCSSWQKGHRMRTEELKALKNELQQLNVELKKFKEERLTARIKELEQIIRAPARRSHLRRAYTRRH